MMVQQATRPIHLSMMFVLQTYLENSVTKKLQFGFASSHYSGLHCLQKQSKSRPLGSCRKQGLPVCSYNRAVNILGHVDILVNSVPLLQDCVDLADAQKGISCFGSYYLICIWILDERRSSCTSVILYPSTFCPWIFRVWAAAGRHN